MNVTGDAIDYGEPIQAKEQLPILREAPQVSELSSTTEMFETGIKVMTFLPHTQQVVKWDYSVVPVL